MDLTPPSDRPFVDSTTSNSELDLPIGYNGLEWLTGQNRFDGRGELRRGNMDFGRFRRDNPTGIGSTPLSRTQDLGGPGPTLAGSGSAGNGSGTGSTPDRMGAAPASPQATDGTAQQPFVAGGGFGGRRDGFWAFGAGRFGGGGQLSDCAGAVH